MPTYLSPGVYVEEVDSGSRPIEGVGTAVAAFVGLAEKGAFNTPTLVTNWTQFTQAFGDFVEGTYLAHAVYGYFLNGGGACYVVRIGGNGADPAGPKELPPAAATLGDYRITSSASPEETVTVEVVHPSESDAPDDLFKLVVKRDGNVEEEYDKVTTKKGRQNVVTVVNPKSKLIQLEEVDAKATPARPEEGSAELVPATVPPQDLERLLPSDYVGNSADRTGFGGLEAIDPVTMLCVPDLMGVYQQGLLDSEDVQAVQLGMIAHCESLGDRMAILDPLPGLNADQVREWRVEKTGYDSKYATLYWPWIKVMDPPTGKNIFVPPCGHVAGVWGRSDDTHGVHKAPANEVVRGAISLELNLTKAEHDLLNPEGINCIRAFAGRGIRIWGARTLSSDPLWRYINIRRLFNYLEESILEGTEWAVFEPNDNALWAKIRRTISAFLINEWRKGALFGLTPDQAFFVKCDDETNPAESIDAGMVICEVGVAPVKPAEFVIFRISQYSGGASLTE